MLYDITEFYRKTNTVIFISTSLMPLTIFEDKWIFFEKLTQHRKIVLWVLTD